MFLNPVDIANRACQHVGVQRIADFTEDTVQASECSFVYDKVRRAELRRNTWRFAVKRAAMRAISTGTMLLNPALWSSVTTYAYGAIVADSNGFVWQSVAQDNLNNAPGGSTAWEGYFGPMTAQPYDTTGTTGYFSGELVYETPGDGTYTTYLSLTSNNAQDPRAPSEWIATVQYSKDQVVQYYALWLVGTTYAAGDTIRYGTLVYVSLAAGNVGNIPSSSPAKWVAVPATLAPAYYDATVAYTVGQFVTYAGLNYVCILASTGNLPTNVTYFAPQGVGTYYTSAVDFNLNNNPATSPTLWTSGTLFGKANITWLTVAVSLVDLALIYPVGAGPADQVATRNVYRLPANFLRRAPQDPKAGSASYIGAPSNLQYDDWNLEGQYLVSRESFPIVLRFVADVTDVRSFDDMYCEGLGARIALEICERVTQSTNKLGAIAAAYNKFMTDARVVNGIETGATEPPLDDYLACRV